MAVEPNAALVGGQGAAKTVSLMVTCIVNAMNDPTGFSLVGRLNMPALESSTMKTFLELVEPDMGEWAESKRIWTFKNGHQVIFKHLDITDPKIAGHIRSMNLSAAYVDEASEINEEVYFLLLGRLRRRGSRRIFRMTSNPAGHDWMWRQFFDPDRKEELKESNLGVVVSSFDNPFLTDDYLDRMLSIYPDDWAQRFIYGSFSDFSDLIYKEFTEKTHCWDAGRAHAVFGGLNEPPLSWPVIVGIDIGSDIDPWAWTFDAVAPDGRLYQYAEIYGNSMLIATMADQAKYYLQGRLIQGIAYDYSMRQVGIELQEHGITAWPAIKEVEPGLFKVSQYMHIDPRLVHPFNERLAGSPRAFISNRCKNSIRETGEYKWKRDRSGQSQNEPAHQSSHSPDARRYAIHTFRPLPAKQREAEKWENPALDIQSRLYWRDQDAKDERLGKLRPHGELKTMEEWRAQAERPPLRFQRFHSFRKAQAWQNKILKSVSRH